jgi:hypothetical protein
VTVGLELTDLAGNSLMLPFQFNFTTEPDVFSPYVVGHFPVGIEIDLDAHVSVTFNEEMNRTSVEQSFIIIPSVSGTFSWDGNTVTFHPQLLSGNTEYDITIRTTASDVFGNPLDSPYEFSFTTKVDPDPPYVVEVAPVGSDVSVNSEIVIQFNELMDLSSLQGKLVVVPYIPGTVELQNDILVFTPNGKLSRGTTYNITLLGSAKDLAGNQMGENYTWEFTTEDASVTTTSPFAWDVVFFSLFFIIILLILVLLVIDFIRKRKEPILKDEEEATEEKSKIKEEGPLVDTPEIDNEDQLEEPQEDEPEIDEEQVAKEKQEDYEGEPETDGDQLEEPEEDELENDDQDDLGEDKQEDEDPGDLLDDLLNSMESQEDETS